MNRSKFFRGCVIAVTCTGMLAAQLAQAAGPQRVTTAAGSAAAVSIRDVSLQDGGVFQGTVVDELGTAKAGIPVTVSRDGQLVAKTETDANGQFSVARLNGGVYQVQSSAGSGVYRLWAPNTAPPSAEEVAVISQDTSVVRGQLGGNGAFSWLANPWVLAGLIAAAIAIPLALDDDDAS